MDQLPLPPQDSIFFICTREKSNPEKSFCGKTISPEQFRELKQWVKQNNYKKKVKLIETGCQGYCPVARGIVTGVRGSERKVFACEGVEEIKTLIKECDN